MVNVGSLPVEGKQLFDLDTQAGITAVLLAVRASELSAAQKNELRDLVFSYTNGGKDQTVRLSLEQKIATFGLVPVATKTVAPAAPKREQPTIGNFRNAPAFSVPVAPIVKKEEVSAPVPLPVAEPAPVVRSVPVAPTPVQEAPVPMPTIPAEETVAVPPVQLPKADQQQYLERIREIKSLVNEKVGNPVNLVDINNEVGREYMSALLDAMKRINSGQSADGSMQRLETAYVSVEETLKSVGTIPSAADPAPAAAPQYVPPTPAPQMAYVPPTPEPTPTPYVPAEPVYTPPTPVAAPIQQYQPVATPVPVYEPVAAIPQYQAAQPTPHFEPAPQPVVPTPNYSQPAPTPIVHSPTPQTFSSLADMVQQSNAQAGLPTTPSAPAPLVSGDPLLAPLVEDGLNQLLSEWSIFKKSGLFGSGPKGREHPLYKKMAELQIPLLLAGRFEGATQEVRQSLTDYMNGWRYEQGLIYEKGEVFEHYLRRVIRHILDQQKR